MTNNAILPKEGYDFYTNRAYEIAQKIAGEYDGYVLGWKAEGYNATIYFKSKNHFRSGELKNIGTLCFDPKTENITYYKVGFVETEHKFKKAESLGVCWDILRKLTPDDWILIQEKTKSGLLKRYSMSVRMALTFAVEENFMQFKEQGFEKQLFIPEEAFKISERKPR